MLFQGVSEDANVKCGEKIKSKKQKKKRGRGKEEKKIEDP